MKITWAGWRVGAYRLTVATRVPLSQISALPRSGPLVPMTEKPVPLVFSVTLVAAVELELTDPPKDPVRVERVQVPRLVTEALFSWNGARVKAARLDHAEQFVPLQARTW